MATTRPDALAAAKATQEVVNAHRTATRIAVQGWRFQQLQFDAHTATASVSALSPTRRVVTVGWDLRGDRPTRQQVPGRRAAAQLLRLARDVADIGQGDAETGGSDLDTLIEAMQATGLFCPPPRSWWRDDWLPGIPGRVQPPPATRAAAWLLARLIGKYGWHIEALGGQGGGIGGGGFVATIPHDTIAVFPAAMDDDGTAAAALARIIGRLDVDQLNTLACINYHRLWTNSAGARTR